MSSTLALHSDTTFNDATLHLAGHAYTACTFNRCTLIVGDAMFRMHQCTFCGCVWRFELTVHDLPTFRKAEAFLQTAFPTLNKLPEDIEEDHREHGV